MAYEGLQPRTLEPYELSTWGPAIASLYSLQIHAGAIEPPPILARIRRAHFLTTLVTVDEIVLGAITTAPGGWAAGQRDCTEITHLAVNPEVADKGARIGSKLVGTVAAHVLETGRAPLWALAAEKARGFYQKLGFTIPSEQDDIVYAIGEDGCRELAMRQGFLRGALLD